MNPLQGYSRVATGAWGQYPRRRKENLDRFIPNRSAMDLDYARYMLTDGRKRKEIKKGSILSLSDEAYLKQLDEACDMNRRILAFKDKSPPPKQWIPSSSPVKPSKPLRRIPQTAQYTLDIPDMIDDHCLNLMDWGSNNVLALALQNTIYLRDGSNGSVLELDAIDDGDGPVTSVSWAADGQHIAVGLNNSDVQLWDYTTNQLLRNFGSGHRSRVGSLDWRNHILTTGGKDGKIINHDVRARSHIIDTFRGHQQEVCQLKWSASGEKLASGGNDDLVYIWDRSMTSTHSRSQWLHRLKDHSAAVKALAWCPFQHNLLASGGGASDCCIKFWDTETGACMDSVGTGSEVTALLWNKNEHELLSSHGFTKNQLVLWRYPSLVKIVELTGHSSKVLFMDHSPDGRLVATASADETLKLWNAFGAAEVKRDAPKAKHPVSFPHIGQIR